MIPTLRDPFGDNVLEIYGPNGTLIGGREGACALEPAWIDLIITSELNMQLIGCQQYVRVARCLFRCQLSKLESPSGGLSVLAGELSQSHKCLGGRVTVAPATRDL